MKDEQASMQGVTQERAYELVTNDKIDDLLEEVLKGEVMLKSNVVSSLFSTKKSLFTALFISFITTFSLKRFQSIFIL